MRKLTVFIIFSSVAPIFAISSCSHITNRARVDEGVNISTYVIKDYETTDPSEGSWEGQEDTGVSTEYLRTDYLVNLGYAWRLRNERKMMIYLNMATADRDPFRFMPALGFYYQATPDSLPYAAGVGAIVLVDPLIYAIWGRDIADFVEIDMAGGFSLIPSIFAHMKLLKKFGPVQLGVIGEYRRF